jgi:hypothetical protein
MSYSPRYVSIHDIPVQIPDDYTDSQKEDALEYAELSLQLDLNDGEIIPQEDQIVIMESAIKQLATCHLAKSAEDPDDVTLGDIDDSGSNKIEYANSFCDQYEETITRIINSGVLDKRDDGESNAPFTYTTGHP